jgi:pimeloyl-ACP methyl ester carboxylesterase
VSDLSDAALAAAVRSALPASVPVASAAEVLLEGKGRRGGGRPVRATIALRDGRASVRPGGTDHPTTRIRAGEATLAALADGSGSGVGAFLDGDLDVRGDLSLALRLDGLLGGRPGRPDRYPRGAMVQAGRVATAHLEAGPPDGPPVLALHGLGATNASMLPTLWDLAADHRVLAPDLPGHGASSAPWLARYDAATFSGWATRYLDAVGVTGPAVVVGNSLGGRIALEVALAAPDRVRALVLLCPAVAFRRLRQLAPLARLARPELASFPVPMGFATARRGLEAMFADPRRIPASHLDAAAGEFARVYRDAAHRVAFFSALRSIYLDDAFGPTGFWRRLPGLVPPALFVWGGHDILVPAGFARHVTEALPRSVSVTFEDCGHVPQYEHPARTHAAIRDFLRGVPVDQ